jgi:hypothetical protein
VIVTRKIDAAKISMSRKSSSGALMIARKTSFDGGVIFFRSLTTRPDYLHPIHVHLIEL